MISEVNALIEVGFLAFQNVECSFMKTNMEGMQLHKERQISYNLLSYSSYRQIEIIFD